MKLKKYVSWQWLGLLALTTATFTSCERELSQNAVLSTLETDGEVFIDGFSANLDYLPYELTNDTDFSEETNDANIYAGDASMRFDIPGDNFSGAAFITNNGADVPRDLSGYDALTFWAKATVPVTITNIGFGQDFVDDDGFDYEVGFQGLELSTAWQKYQIAIPDPDLLTSQMGLLWYSALPNEDINGGFTFWLDEVQFEVTNLVDAKAGYLFGGDDFNTTLFDGQTYQIDGATALIAYSDGEVQELNIGSSYLSYESSDTSVATVDSNGLVTVVSTGSATISATLDGGSVEGSLVITALDEVTEATSPTVDEDSVISLYSDAYTDILGVNYNLYWEPFQSTDGGDTDTFGFNTIYYNDYNFVGWDISSEEMDTESMNQFHIDIYPVTTAPDISITFQSSTVEEATYTITGLTANEWNSIDIPLYSFNNSDLFDDTTSYNYIILGGGSGNLENQIIGENILFDNLYFYDNGEEEVCESDIDEVDEPTVDSSLVVSIYGDTYGSLTDISFNQFWEPWQSTEGDESDEFCFDAVYYTNFNFVGWNISGDTIDASSTNTFHVDIYPISSTTDITMQFESDSGNISYTITGLVADQWNSLDISLSSFVNNSLFDTVTSFNWLVISGGTGQVDGATGEELLIDNVYFYDNGEEEEESNISEPTAPTEASNSVISLYSDSYTNIDGVSVNQFWEPWQTTDGGDSADYGFNAVSYTDFNFVGWNISGGTIDASSSTTLSIDIYPITTTTDITVQFEDGSTNSNYTITGLVADEWNYIDIPLSSFSNPTMFDTVTSYTFLVFSGGSGAVDTTVGESLVIDNVYFY